MLTIPFSTGDHRRLVAKEASLICENRFFEQNPALSSNGASLIARPGARKAFQSGNGPIRGVYSQPGTFNDDLFFVTENSLRRLSTAGVITTIGDISGFSTQATVSFAATANIGEDIPEYLFVADGSTLWLYIESGYARGILTASAVANNDTFKIDTTYYKWTSGSVNAGTPDGTVGNPWLIALGASLAISIDNAFKAINASGTAGTTYSTALTEHATATATAASSGDLHVRAKIAGAGGNSISTTETGANMAWGAATLQNGGSPSLTAVETPDDVGVIGVLHLSSYVIVIPAQGSGINGRVYWIEPGETIINPLNFVTAESSPDPILQALTFFDQAVLFGKDRTEFWFFSGDSAAPFQRLRGVAFNRGIWEGTAVQIDDSLVLVDNNGSVLQIDGSGATSISNPAIEEQIREAMSLQASLGY